MIRRRRGSNAGWLIRRAIGEKTNQRLGWPLTNSPCLMRAMRHEGDSRCSGCFRRTVFFFVDAGPVKRTIWLPLLVWLMTLPILAMNNKTLGKCTLGHAQWQGVAEGENNVPQEDLPQRSVSLWQRQEVQEMLLRERLRLRGGRPGQRLQVHPDVRGDGRNSSRAAPEIHREAWAGTRPQRTRFSSTCRIPNTWNT